MAPAMAPAMAMAVIPAMAVTLEHTEQAHTDMGTPSLTDTAHTATHTHPEDTVDTAPDTGTPPPTLDTEDTAPDTDTVNTVLPTAPDTGTAAVMATPTGATEGGDPSLHQDERIIDRRRPR